MAGLSVLIPAFNADKFLLECIESIRRQKHSPEIIIGVDGCQKTLSFIEANAGEFKGIRVLMFEENVGPYVIKNTLFKQSKSNIVLFFDADDVMKDTMVERMLLATKKFELIYSAFANFSGDLSSAVITKSSIERYGADGVPCMYRSVFDRLGAFEAWRCAADSEFRARAGRMGIRMTVIRDPLFCRRIHEGNITSALDTGEFSPMRTEHRKEIARRRLVGYRTSPKRVMGSFREVL